MDDTLGYLTPGDEADIVLLDPALNMTPATDPVKAIVDSAGPQDVDTVMVGGVIVKQGGAILTGEPREQRHAADSTLTDVLERSAPPIDYEVLRYVRN